MGIQSIFSFFKTHKKTIFYSIIFLGYILFTTHSAFAAPTDAGQGGLSKEESDKLISYLNMALKACAAVLGLATSFISIFLYPGWVNGTMFGLQDYLKEIWILVSNVIYFIFAGILIAIAFMNIIGKGEGTWELKQAMPRFIVGVLIVPFSWFMVQFLLSLSAILTVGVLTLPYNSFQNQALFQGAMANSEMADQKFCKDIILNFGDKPVGQAVSEGDNSFGETIRCKDGEGSKVSIKEIISGEGAGKGVDNSVFGVISVYTYGILRVQEFDTVVKGDLTTVKGMMDLIFKIIFDLLFVIVYALLMVALFLALLTRGIRLWVFMMLSPVFGLLYFLGKTGDGSGAMEKFSPKEFVALAMVPVYVAAALAFGLTFIMVASEGIKVQSKSTDMDTLKAGGFSLSIVGAHGDGKEEKSVIGKLIVELFGVAILWIAVMAALSQSKITGAVVEPIAAFGKSMGELATKAPGYMPIIPTGNKENPMMSITSLSSAGSQFKSAVEGGQTSRGSALGSAMATKMGIGDSEASKLSSAMSRFSTELEGASPPSQITKNNAFNALVGGVTAKSLGANQAIKADFNKYMKQIFRESYTEDMSASISKASEGDIDVKLRDIFLKLNSDPSKNNGQVIEKTFGKAIPTKDDIERVLGGNKSDAPNNPGVVNLNLTSNSTVTGLVDGGTIKPDVAGDLNTNASRLAFEVRDGLNGGKITRTKLVEQLEAVGLSDKVGQNKVIDILGDSVN